MTLVSNSSAVIGQEYHLSKSVELSTSQTLALKINIYKNIAQKLDLRYSSTPWVFGIHIWCEVLCSLVIIASAESLPSIME